MRHTFDEQTSAQHLAGLVKFPTVSHHEEEKMDFNVFFAMQKYMEETYPLIHRTMTKEIIGKAALLYCWKGTGTSEKLPLLFMAHQDVVPEGDHTKWKYPPYDGVIAEGQVWGRGSSDCKSNITAQLEAIEYLISTGFQPDYDIYLAYGYNEEVSGGNAPDSAGLIAQTLIGRGIRIGAAFDEGGGMRGGRSMGIEGNVAAFGVAEKGYADFKISRKDVGGHSARPHKDGALEYVAKAILAIAANPFPYRIIEPVKQRYEILAPYMKSKNPELSELLSDVEGNWEKLLPYIDKDPEMGAMFHTTMAITMASGSDQANILPEVASVTVNCRLLSGDTLESVQKYIESIVPEGMEVTLVKGNNPSPFSTVDTDIARLVWEVCKDLYDENTILLPDIQVGGTDARYMYEACENVYRFASFLKKEGKGRAHQVNETMDTEVLAKGSEFYVELLTRY